MFLLIFKYLVKNKILKENKEKIKKNNNEKLLFYK